MADQGDPPERPWVGQALLNALEALEARDAPDNQSDTALLQSLANSAPGPSGFRIRGAAEAPKKLCNLKPTQNEPSTRVHQPQTSTSTADVAVVSSPAHTNKKTSPPAIDLTQSSSPTRQDATLITISSTLPSSSEARPKQDSQGEKARLKQSRSQSSGASEASTSNLRLIEQYKDRNPFLPKDLALRSKKARKRARINARKKLQKFCTIHSKAELEALLRVKKRPFSSKEQTDIQGQDLNEMVPLGTGKSSLGIQIIGQAKKRTTSFMGNPPKRRAQDNFAMSNRFSPYPERDSSASRKRTNFGPSRHGSEYNSYRPMNRFGDSYRPDVDERSYRETVPYRGHSGPDHSYRHEQRGPSGTLPTSPMTNEMSETWLGMRSVHGPDLFTTQAQHWAPQPPIPPAPYGYPSPSAMMRPPQLPPQSVWNTNSSPKSTPAMNNASAMRSVKNGGWVTSSHALNQSGTSSESNSHKIKNSTLVPTPNNHRKRGPVASPAAPMPTAEYLRRANLPLVALPKPQSLLLIIDLNGTLLSRTNNRSTFIPRPNVQEFLSHLLTHHHLMIWSSSREENVNSMVSQLFTPAQRTRLIAVWSRKTLRLTPDQYYSKVQVYKQLEWVWEAPIARRHPRMHAGVRWDQSNTLLIDDSREKGRANPFSLIEVPEFVPAAGNNSVDALGEALAYIEKAKWYADVSAFGKNTPFRVGASDLSWNWGETGETGEQRAEGQETVKQGAGRQELKGHGVSSAQVVNASQP